MTEENPKFSDVLTEPLEAIARAARLVPATPGYFVIEIYDDYTVASRLPVIAFYIDVGHDDEPDVRPVSVSCDHGDHALVCPDGRVISRLGYDKRLGKYAGAFRHGRIFESEDEFNSALRLARKVLAEAQESSAA
jgi:hypothetical protein